MSSVKDDVDMMTYNPNSPSVSSMMMIPSSSNMAAVDECAPFVADFCSRRGLPDEPGLTAVERECASIAHDAREEFKHKRITRELLQEQQKERQQKLHDPFGMTREGSGGTRMDVEFDADADADADDDADAVEADGEVNVVEGKEANSQQRRKVAAEKYKRRLENNRKSAQAAKVYREVYTRAISASLSRMTKRIGRSSSSIASPSSPSARRVSSSSSSSAPLHRHDEEDEGDEEQGLRDGGQQEELSMSKQSMVLTLNEAWSLIKQLRDQVAKLQSEHSRLKIQYQQQQQRQMPHAPASQTQWPMSMQAPHVGHRGGSDGGPVAGRFGEDDGDVDVERGAG